MFRLLFKQTFLLAFRGAGIWKIAFFYIVLTGFSAFAPGFSEHGEALLALGMLHGWLATLPMVVERDREDGTLEQLMLQPAPLWQLIFARILGQGMAIALQMSVAGFIILPHFSAALQLWLLLPIFLILSALHATFILRGRGT